MQLSGLMMTQCEDTRATSLLVRPSVMFVPMVRHRVALLR